MYVPKKMVAVIKGLLAGKNAQPIHQVYFFIRAGKGREGLQNGEAIHTFIGQRSAGFR